MAGRSPKKGVANTVEPILAANYSHALLDHLAVEPGLVDAVKVSEFDRDEYLADYRLLRAQGYPLILHGLGQDVVPGTPEFATRFDPDLLGQAVALCEPTYLSTHIEWRTQVECPGREAFTTSLQRDVDKLRSLVGLPVHLENVFHYRSRPGSPAPTYRNPPFIGDPEFIVEMVERLDTRLLLDIGHAQVAAWHRGEAVEDYLEQLPLTSVTEIHVSGPILIGGELRDRHVEVDEAGYSLLRLALDRSSAKVVSLEYGGVGPIFADRSEPIVLQRQLKRLRAIVAGA
jgi:uncharacterized protein (UPF0276 family)